MSSLNYAALLTNDSDIQKAGAAVIIGATLILFGRVINKKLVLSNGQVDPSLILPADKGGWFGLVDFALNAFVNFFDSILGKNNRKHFPFIATIFFFVLTANLSGLIPGMPAITTTVWINVALAVTVFIYFNAQGIKAHGIVGYLKHFCGPLVLLAPLMFPLEIFSTFLRILTLNLRLYWNIAADHMVLEIFTSLLGPVLPIVFLVLGTFVCFMQAFIFATLTCVYILLASDHGEEEGHH